MKNLLIFISILFYGVAMSQNQNYVKSSPEANLILFNKFKEHRENHELYGKMSLNVEGSDILFHKSLWQSKGHFLSHGNDPNYSWDKVDNHSHQIANINSDTVWKPGCTSGEISIMVPIWIVSEDTTTIKDTLQKHINSQQFMEECFDGFINSPPHNAHILNESVSDLNHTLYGQYVNKFNKTYFTISGVIDLSNPKREYNKYGKNKYYDYYYAVITCVISWVKSPITYVYPVSYEMGDMNKEYIYTDHSSTIRSRINKNGRVEIKYFSPFSEWKRISKKKFYNSYKITLDPHVVWHN